ncbi:hypothetical protein SBA3_2440013 [Candidatus Sulfopaludibacter sp. SbA3]|nr:hypothetical protein SBA3_2440013 [Candidatus Sulfopaludibacter sp. SbA3]
MWYRRRSLLGWAFRPRNGTSRRRLHSPTGDKIAGVTQSLDRFFDPASGLLYVTTTGASR